MSNTVEEQGTLASLSSTEWQSQVFSTSLTVLLHFGADWCHQCKALEPRVEQLSSELPWLKVFKVDIGHQAHIASELGVKSLPTLLVIKDGSVKAQLRPDSSCEDLRKAIEEL